VETAAPQGQPLTGGDAAVTSWLDPLVHGEVYAFVSVPLTTDLRDVQAVAVVREPTSWTLVLPVHEAEQRGWDPLFCAAWITLRAPTALDALGVTAAFSRALADAEIACNVFAGAQHDHVFVADEDRDRAAEVLRAVQPIRTP